MNTNSVPRRKQQLLRKLPRMLEAHAAAVVADECQWAVAIHETIQTNTAAINHLLTTKRTLLGWMIFVVLPTRVQAAQQANKCLLVQHQCFHLEVTAVARWALVVL
jgi:hypothetical protein